MNNATDFVIDTRRLGKAYHGVDALKSLDLKVPKNSVFGFLGPNGAGKTTAIKLLLGLARPTSGKAMVFGGDTVKDSIAIRKRMGYLPQDPRFYEHMTARETLIYSLRFFFNGPENRLKDRVQHTLELVGLADKADRSIKGFSGGERQRLGIAQAQVHHPDLLILDEPAAALDPMGRRDVLKVMERLREHATIFYSTHILDDVQRVSDMVAILNHGEMVAHAPIKELLAGAGTRFTLKLKGDTKAAYERVAAQEWIDSIKVSNVDGYINWQVIVSDVKAAETHLLHLAMADKDTTIISFGRHQYNLEQVFVQIVEGAQDDH
ncbi:MAG: ABC transporter ATP-binding protein [Proteobacteria bacterium]|nr:ABC transporter ATP-binding protein [Pseudomonadota bacterium]